MQLFIQGMTQDSQLTTTELTTTEFSTTEFSTTAEVNMRAAIQDIAVGPDRGRDITQQHAESVMRSILAGEVDEVQTAIFLIALRMKRESLAEFLGLFAALTSSAQRVCSGLDHVLCLADPFDGYLRNATITPFMPAVLAAHGFHSVMHGVKSVGPKHGVTANKVYQLAGANVAQTVVQANQTLEETGACYVDQSAYAPELYALQSVRHKMVKRSALTTLERLLVPISGRKSTHLVLGYVHKAYPDIYAKVAFAAGFQSAVLIKGVEGGLAPALNKPMRRFNVEHTAAKDIDAQKQVITTPFSETAPAAAQAMDKTEPMVEQCLENGLAALNGTVGLARDSLSLACGQIINAHRADISLELAVEKVQNCLDNGAALERFNAFCAATG